MHSGLVSRFLLCGLLIALMGCSKAYYSAWESFGVYKRDLLKKKIDQTKEEQVEATEQFKDALTRIRELYGFQGGDLEKVYTGLQQEYDQSKARADAVRKRIREMESIAADLFSEWEKEIGEISSERLRASSRAKLRETQSRYQNLERALRRSETSMDPVLGQLKDQVLFLKHNLNAQAVTAMKDEARNIEREIGTLIKEMQRSIEEADKFLKNLEG